MKSEILVGDKVKWNGSSNNVYTVLKIEELKEYGYKRYLVTHPSMLFPKSGMWIYPHEIIRLVQERDVK